MPKTAIAEYTRVWCQNHGVPILHPTDLNLLIDLSEGLSREEIVAYNLAHDRTPKDTHNFATYVSKLRQLLGVREVSAWAEAHKDDLYAIHMHNTPDEGWDCGVEACRDIQLIRP